jgi:predicted DNA-binding transcriptional regulator AlpA
MPEVPACAPLDPLLTVEDLERLLRVDRRTVSRLCKKGQLPPPIKLGGSNRWRVRDVEKIL